MKTLSVALAATALVVAATSANGANFNHWGHDQGPNHQWHTGEHMGQNDWRQSQTVDWRAHHLRQPPRGYEWRQVNGQYVLAAITTGVILSILLNQR